MLRRDYDAMRREATKRWLAEKFFQQDFSMTNHEVDVFIQLG